MAGSYGYRGVTRLKILAVSFPAGWPTQAFLSGAHHDTPDVNLGERVDILGRRLSISDTLKTCQV